MKEEFDIRPPRSEDYLDRFISAAFDPQGRLGQDTDSAVGVETAFADEESEVPETLGRYPVLDRLGVGGVGVIYRVLDPDLGREIALKVIRPACAQDPDLVRRFMEEARVASRIQHPGIVPIHEMGRLFDGRPYFTMKVVEGRTLAEILEDRRKTGIDTARLLEVFARVAETLAYAHAHGVIHGDLKPHNVMVGTFGEVQVLDWGLASRRPASARPRRRTRAWSARRRTWRRSRRAATARGSARAPTCSASARSCARS
jgi:serine/threonine protein kinase